MISEIFSLSLSSLVGLGIYVTTITIIDNHLSREEKRLKK
jgi:hypothetical protein